MIISHKYKFIFIKTLKTAGTSLEVYLSNICDTKDVFTPIYPRVEGHNPRNYKTFFNPWYEFISYNYNLRKGARALKDSILRNAYYNHINAQRVRSRLGEEKWNEYFKFTIERNPWDKTVSYYHMYKKRSGGDISFKDFLELDKLPIDRYRYTDSKTELPIVDKIIKYENLHEELVEVFASLNIPFNGLNVFAKSNYNKEKLSYKEYYDIKLEDFISKKFKFEIDTFGYRF